MARTKRRWSVLTVCRREGRKVFLHGNSLIKSIPGFFLDDGDPIRVFRKSRLFDTGKACDMGGHDWATRFDGLEQIIPARDRFSAQPKGLFDPLRPGRFEIGDIVRIPVASARVRSLLDGWPEYRQK